MIDRSHSRLSLVRQYALLSIIRSSLYCQPIAASAQALGYQTPGQVVQAVSPRKCLPEHAGALSSVAESQDIRTVDSLISASSLS